MFIHFYPISTNVFIIIIYYFLFLILLFHLKILSFNSINLYEYSLIVYIIILIYLYLIYTHLNFINITFKHYQKYIINFTIKIFVTKFSFLIFLININVISIIFQVKNVTLDKIFINYPIINKLFKFKLIFEVIYLFILFNQLIIIIFVLLTFCLINLHTNFYQYNKF